MWIKHATKLIILIAYVHMNHSRIQKELSCLVQKLFNDYFFLSQQEKILEETLRNCLHLVEPFRNKMKLKGDLDPPIPFGLTL